MKMKATISLLQDSLNSYCKDKVIEFDFDKDDDEVAITLDDRTIVVNKDELRQMISMT